MMRSELFDRFVILNAVKDLLFTMLLRPVKSANRSFTIVQDDKKVFQKRHSKKRSNLVRCNEGFFLIGA